MPFYDIVRFQSQANSSIILMLGFKDMLYMSPDGSVSKGENKKKIIGNEAGEGKIIKELSSGDTLCLLANTPEISDNVLAHLALEEKPLALSASRITNYATSRDLTKQLSRYSALVKRAKKAKVKLAIASFAKGKEELISLMQLRVLAEYLGFTKEEAREAAAIWGEIL